MKKRFIVVVDIDTDKPAAERDGSGASMLSEGFWRISMGNDQKTLPYGASKETILATVSHELGHVLSCEIMGNWDDSLKTRNMSPAWIGPNECLKEEENAWLYAQVVFSGTKEYALNTYHKAIAQYQRVRNG